MLNSIPVIKLIAVEPPRNGRRELGAVPSVAGFVIDSMVLAFDITKRVLVRSREVDRLSGLAVQNDQLGALRARGQRPPEYHPE